MPNFIVKITAKRQVTLPARVLEALGVKPGDRRYESLPRPPFTETETEENAARVYNHVWQQSASGHGLATV